MRKHPGEGQIVSTLSVSIEDDCFKSNPSHEKVVDYAETPGGGSAEPL